MGSTEETRLLPLGGEAIEARLSELAALLHACVHAGASIGFVAPFPLAQAEAFWRGTVAPAARRRERLVLAAEVAGRIVGSGQVSLATPPNQPHRAEIMKVMVDPGFRRRGVARALMGELERLAAAKGRRLVTLDTRTGDFAEPLYASLGYSVAGIIPGYCRDPLADRLNSTTMMYKTL